MNAIELIKANRLSDARSLLANEVKKSPKDAGSRTLLFQVLCFFAEWDKAEGHLDILAMQDSRAEIGVRAYKNLISAERERSEVINGDIRPSFMTGTPPFLDMHFFAWEKLKEGKTEEASERYRKIESETPVVRGKLDGKQFRGVRNMDAFISTFLEIFVHERYLWAPFSSLRELSIPEPGTLLDLLWTPATITTWEGLTTNCFLPVTYPGSAKHGNDMVRLGKITDWRDVGGGFYTGTGQHMFLIGNDEIPLLEIRELLFSRPGSKNGTEDVSKRKKTRKKADS